MLILSRNLDQEIVVGDNIRIRVLAIQGNKIRLGIAAPRQVSIERHEARQSNTDSTGSSPRPMLFPAS